MNSRSVTAAPGGAAFINIPATRGASHFRIHAFVGGVTNTASFGTAFRTDIYINGTDPAAADASLICSFYTKACDRQNAGGKLELRFPMPFTTPATNRLFVQTTLIRSIGGTEASAIGLSLTIGYEEG
jgi:hypothetical protein